MLLLPLLLLLLGRNQGLPLRLVAPWGRAGRDPGLLELLEKIGGVPEKNPGRRHAQEGRRRRRFNGQPLRVAAAP